MTVELIKRKQTALQVTDFISCPGFDFAKRNLLLVEDFSHFGHLFPELHDFFAEISLLLCDLVAYIPDLSSNCFDFCFLRHSLISRLLLIMA